MKITTVGNIEFSELDSNWYYQSSVEEHVIGGPFGSHSEAVVEAFQQTKNKDDRASLASIILGCK